MVLWKSKLLVTQSTEHGFVSVSTPDGLIMKVLVAARIGEAKIKETIVLISIHVFLIVNSVQL